MLTTTRIFLYLLGVAAIAIGLMIFCFGPDKTANIFGTVLGVALGSDAYSGGLEHVNVDSEMRFYSVFWIAYGVLLLWLTARLESHARWVFFAIALFFAGGVGRLFSLVTIGWPDPLFVALMIIELVSPILVALMFSAGLRAQT